MKHICKTLLLLSLAALFCVLPLASCIPGKGGISTTQEDTPIDPNAPEDTYDWARAQVPSVSYEGRDFRILVCKSVSQFDTQNGDLARNVVAKELLDIPINDAVFSRNMDLQTQLGITIRQ